MERTDVPQTASQPPNAKGLSFRGLIEVFYQPAALFQKLKNNPRILIPYLVLAVVVVGFFLGAADLIVEMQKQSPQFQVQMQGQSMTAEMEKYVRISTIVFGSLSLLMAPLLAALLGLFWVNFVFGGKASFKTLLSVMVHSELIYGLGLLVTLPMMLAKGTIKASLSLGVLAAGAAPDSITFVALSKIDVFIVWEIIVIGIGLSIICNVTRNKGYLLSVLSMGMLSILHVVFTAVGKLIF